MKDKRKLPPEEEEKRMRLYKKGLTNAEIAKRCGVTSACINSWRTRKNLPLIMPKTQRKPGKCKFTKATGVPMGTVLTPAECRAMRRFLSCLVYGHKMNSNLDVSYFMTEYRRMINGYVRRETEVSA